MKKFIILFSALGFLVTTAFTGDAPCSGNDFFIQGVKSKMGYYKADGTQAGLGTSEVKKVYTSGDSTIAVLNSTYTDLKSNKSNTNDMRVICVNGILVVDMNAAISQAMGGSHDMKMVCTGNLVGYKQSYVVGEKLDSLHMKMDMYKDDAIMMTTNVRVYDRVVQSYEDLTTGAGVFKCYKISYMSSGTTTMRGMAMPTTKPTKTVMYYCPKIGMVRMETYGADDKIFSYSQLLELTKP